jgi:hypothetical protein
VIKSGSTARQAAVGVVRETGLTSGPLVQSHLGGTRRATAGLSWRRTSVARREKLSDAVWHSSGSSQWLAEPPEASNAGPVTPSGLDLRALTCNGCRLA